MIFSFSSCFLRGETFEFRRDLCVRKSYRLSPFRQTHPILYAPLFACHLSNVSRDTRLSSHVWSKNLTLTLSLPKVRTSLSPLMLGRHYSVSTSKVSVPVWDVNGTLPHRVTRNLHFRRQLFKFPSFMNYGPVSRENSVSIVDVAKVLVAISSFRPSMIYKFRRCLQSLSQSVNHLLWTFRPMVFGVVSTKIKFRPLDTKPFRYSSIVLQRRGRFRTQVPPPTQKRRTLPQCMFKFPFLRLQRWIY